MLGGGEDGTEEDDLLCTTGFFTGRVGRRMELNTGLLIMGLDLTEDELLLDVDELTVPCPEVPRT